MSSPSSETSQAITESLQGGVLFIRLDDPGSSVNRLRPEWIDRISELLDNAQRNPDVRGVAVVSAKPGSFIAGVDLDLFRTHTTHEAVERLSRQGQEMLDRIEAYPKPIVACIHGSCMGGGTELALACRYRVVSRSPSTRIALPEVKLGLLPGMGGTQRLPRRIGLATALPYLLTGRNLYAKQAAASGFADAAVKPEYLEAAAVRLIHNGLDDKTTKRLRAVRRRAWFQNAPLIRNVILKTAQKQVLKTTQGNYPAPPAILEAVEAGLAQGMKAGLRHEARLFAELAVGPESGALRSLFFAMTAAKRNPFQAASRKDGDSAGWAGAGIIGVAGAGLMGSGIAEVSLAGGDRVILYDLNAEACRKAARTIHKALEKRRRTGQIDRLEMDRQLSSLKTTTRLEDLAPCTLVIEAVVERPDVKRELFRALTQLTSDRTVLASNTSALPISDLFPPETRPAFGVGMHYFSPVQKMPLLEVIRTNDSSEEALHAAVAAGLRQGKTPITVNDGPGFYTTRILAPFMNEALLLFEEGADVRETDRIMRKAGFPVGPFTLLDEVGLDVGAHVGDVLGALFRERGGRTSDLSHRLAADGHTGRKGGAGFYLYGADTDGGSASGRKRKGPRPLNPALAAYRQGGAGRAAEGADGREAGRAASSSTDRSASASAKAETRDRMLLMMVNEAAHCLGEGILQSATDGDLGAILGLGFPPFLGGPFRHIDSKGARAVHERLTELQARHGDRFAPAPLLALHARENRPFHTR